MLIWIITSWERRRGMAWQLIWCNVEYNQKTVIIKNGKMIVAKGTFLNDVTQIEKGDWFCGTSIIGIGEWQRDWGSKKGQNLYDVIYELFLGDRRTWCYCKAGSTLRTYKRRNIVYYFTSVWPSKNGIKNLQG